MIQDIPEMPLVVDDKIQEINKTKVAVKFLRKVKAWTDIEKVINYLSKYMILQFFYDDLSFGPCL